MSVTPQPGWADVLRDVRNPAPFRNSDDVLARALLLGVDVTPQLIGCSVTVGRHSGWDTPQASNDTALELDLVQYRAGVGPCVEAATTGDAVQLDSIGAERRFAAFARAAARVGIDSSLSLPLRGRTGRAAFNLYGAGTAAFDARRAHRVAELLAHVISELLGTFADPGVAGADDAARARGAKVRDAVDLLARSASASTERAYRVLADRSRSEARSIVELAEGVLQDDERGGSL